LGDGKPFRAEMIAQKIKSSLGPAYQGLMLGYLYNPSIATALRMAEGYVW